MTPYDADDDLGPEMTGEMTGEMTVSVRLLAGLLVAWLCVVVLLGLILYELRGQERIVELRCEPSECVVRPER